MDNNQFYTDKKQSFFKSPTFGMIASGLVVFLGVLAFLPEAGFIRTLPLMIVCGFVCERLCSNMLFYCVTAALLNFLMYLFRGSSIAGAFVYTLLAVVLVFCGVYVSKLASLAKKTSNKATKKKCFAYAAASVLVAAVVSVVMCGNVVSALIHDSRNTGYIEEHYGEKVQTRFTAYSPLDGEYRTYIDFADGEVLLGRDNEYFVSHKANLLTDGCRDYFEDKLLETADRRLSLVISEATDAFEITESDIDLEYGEVLPDEPDIARYLDRVRYVVSLYSIIEQRESFEEICRDCVAKISEYEYAFDEIVICGGNSSEVLFSLAVKKGMTQDEVGQAIQDFAPEQVEHLGVTEKTVLDYWYNR